MLLFSLKCSFFQVLYLEQSYLAEKQRSAIMTAYTLGYYDVPKKLGLAQLAERFELAHSALDV